MSRWKYGGWPDIGLGHVVYFVGKPGAMTVDELKRVCEKLCEFVLECIKSGRRLPLVSFSVIDEEECAILRIEAPVFSVGLEGLKYEHIKLVREIIGYDVPLAIGQAKLVLHSKSSRFGPVWGGTQVQTELYGTVAPRTTLGFGAYDAARGVRGVVISGHGAEIGGQLLYAGVHQPTYLADYSNYAGFVTRNPSGPRYSNAAFVPTGRASPYVYLVYLDVYVQGVIKGTRAPSKGLYVYMQGVGYCQSCGKIIDVEYDIPFHPVYGTLYDQVLADCPATGGDSGGPMFVYSW